MASQIDAKMLVENQTYLLKLVKAGKQKEIEDLVKLGHTLNVRDKDGNTLLHIALLNGRSPLFFYLLEKGLSENEVNNKGQTAFQAVLSLMQISRLNYKAFSAVVRVFHLKMDYVSKDLALDLQTRTVRIEAIKKELRMLIQEEQCELRPNHYIALAHYIDEEYWVEYAKKVRENLDSSFTLSHNMIVLSEQIFNEKIQCKEGLDGEVEFSLPAKCDGGLEDNERDSKENKEKKETEEERYLRLKWALFFALKGECYGCDDTQISLDTDDLSLTRLLSVLKIGSDEGGSASEILNEMIPGKSGLSVKAKQFRSLTEFVLNFVEERYIPYREPKVETPSEEATLHEDKEQFEKVQLAISEVTPDRRLEFLNRYRSTSDLKVDYEFLAISFDKRYWANLAQELAVFEEQVGYYQSAEKTSYCLKKEQLGHLIYSKIVQCTEFSDGRLEFTAPEGEPEALIQLETDQERRIRLKWALKFAMEGEDWSSTTRIMFEMMVEKPNLLHIVKCSKGARSLTDVIMKFIEFRYKSGQEKRQEDQTDEAFEAEASSAERMQEVEQAAGTSSSHSSEKKESKEREERRSQEEIERGRQAVFEWSYLAQTDNFPYIMVQAKVIGLKEEEIDKIFLQVCELRALLENPGDFSGLIRLINEGVPVSIKDAHGESLLKLIIRNKWVPVVSDLPKRQDVLEGINQVIYAFPTDPGTTPTDPGITLLKLAVSSGNPALVTAVLSLGADISFKTDYRRLNILMEAIFMEGVPREFGEVEHVNLEIVAILLKAFEDAGLSIDEPDWRGNTALMSAVRTGNTQLTALFLKAGASLNVKNKEGETALLCARHFNHLEMIELLNAEIEKQPANYQRTSLMQAIIKGENKKVSDLISNESIKESINNQDVDGNTALMMAAEKGDSATVLALLKAGAVGSLDKTNSIGETALMLACKGDHSETIQVLLGADASVKEVDVDGNTAFTRVADKGNITMMSLLLQKRASVEGGCRWKGPVLHAACERGDIETVEFLIRKGISVNTINTMREDTPLKRASGAGHTTIVQMLLDAGAGETIHYEGPNSCASALSTAQGIGYTTIVALLQAEIDRRKKDKKKEAEGSIKGDQRQQTMTASSSGSSSSSSTPILHQYSTMTIREDSSLVQIVTQDKITQTISKP